MEMTPEILVKACRDNNGYKQPRLNNQLFLQCRGFCEIANLAPYTELKALWLDQNAIQEMEGLEQLTQLCSLFLQNNAIRRIQGLDNLVNLRTLNLSHNHLAKLSDLRNCPQLETLQVSHNRIERLEDVEEIFLLPKLSCLDLSHNRIDERPADAGDAFLVEFFGRCKELAVLYLHGQDIARKFRNYRKTMVAGLPELTYLDERPVFPQERRAAVAWGEGGADAEKAVMNKIREEREHELTACVRYQQSLNTEENKAKRAAREAVLAEREAAEKEWRSQLRIETTRKCTAADHDEYEARAHLELEYEAACNALSNLAVELRATALALEAQRVAAEKVEAERRAVEAAARAEIEAKERRDLEELQRERAKRQEAFDEMRFWVRKWAREDAADEQELQGQLDALLAELEPPAPHAMPSTGSPSAEDSAMETASDTADSATNESSASSAPKQFKSKKLRRWAASASKFEQMFQAEKAAARPAAS